jgi:hypothetical protein
VHIGVLVAGIGKCTEAMIDIGTGIILIDYQYGQTAGYCQINPGILAEGATGRVQVPMLI